MPGFFDTLGYGIGPMKGSLENVAGGYGQAVSAQKTDNLFDALMERVTKAQQMAQSMREQFKGSDQEQEMSQKRGTRLRRSPLVAKRTVMGDEIASPMYRPGVPEQSMIYGAAQEKAVGDLIRELLSRGIQF